MVRDSIPREDSEFFICPMLLVTSQMNFIVDLTHYRVSAALW